MATHFPSAIARFVVPGLLVALSAGDVELVVKTKLGDEISGLATIPSIQVKTSFGQATVQIEMVQSIELGSPDVVVTRDGTKLKGKVSLDKLTLKTDSGPRTIDAKEITKIRPRVKTTPLPGEIVDGAVVNGLGYHLRVPKNWDPKKAMPAIVIFHGSNMSSKAYVATIVSAWPKLAEDYVILGIDGESRVKDRPDDDPAFNYTYVDFVGKSKFKGYPGTDRESPALVAEALAELKRTFPITKFFVGGHSQGAFLTYSVLMNYPDLVAGAFPVSGGVIFQCEPSAYDNAEVRAAQRRVPLAIVHGENDGTVEFSMSAYAKQIFEDGGFPMLRLFTNKTAAHMFGLLPVEEAVRWLEAMASDSPEVLLGFAEKQLDADPRAATAALERARSLDKGGKLKARAAELAGKIDKMAAAEAQQYAAAIAASSSASSSGASSSDGTWVDGFLEFRAKYAFADCAKPAMEAFAKLRAQHQKSADELFDAARGDFQKQKKTEAYAKCQEIVDKYYASDKYQTAKRWLAERK
jgi:predicted esterase